MPLLCLMQRDCGAGGLWRPPKSWSHCGFSSHCLLTRRLENSHPLLTRFFKLQFFYVPVKRSHGASSGACPSSLSQTAPVPGDPLKHPSPAVCSPTLGQMGWKSGIDKSGF